jgi:predicted RNA-binding protein with PIN domain
MPTEFLIVDGHSMIFAWPELRTLQLRRAAVARERLVKLLTEYQDFTGTRVVVVFDGRGPATNETSEPGGIQIFYSSAGHTADDVVERLTAKYARIYPIIVATADSLEQQTALSFGAHCIGAEGLRNLLNDARTALDRSLQSRLKRGR